MAAPACEGTRHATLEAALAAALAAPGPDRVVIGPVTLRAPGPAGFAYDSPDPVTIAGGGRGTTVLLGAGDGAPGTAVLRLGAGAHVVSGLTVRATADGGVGLALGGAAEARAVTVQAEGAGATGVAMDGTATLAAAAVGAGGAGGTGVATTGAQTVRDTAITATATGVRHDAGAVPGARLERVRITAPTGLRVARGDLLLSDSLVLAAGGVDGAALAVTPAGGDTAALTARRTSLVGDGSAGQTGVDVVAGPEAAIASAAVSDSLVTGFARPVRRVAALSGRADVALRYVNSPAAGTVDRNDDGGTGATAETAVTDLPVAFADAPGGDHRLAAGSPLIDAGDPAADLAGVTDLAGAARPADGDGDGAARVDLGAYESPALTPTDPAPPAVVPPVAVDRLAPRLTAVRVLRRVPGARVVASVRVGEAARVTARLQRRAAGRWVAVGGPVRRGTGTAATLRLTLARAPLRGAYRIRLDAVDAAGNTTLLTAGFGVRAAR